MPNYSSNLKAWGAAGAEYPDGYSHAEGERPVDDWENFLKSNLIDDTSHLINVTNQPVTVNAGNQLTGGGDVELGGSITIDLNQGGGSGLNADKIDGVHASAFADSGHTHDGRYLLESGDTMGGHLDMGGNSIGNVTDLEMDGDIHGAGVDMQIREVGFLQGPTNGDTDLTIETQGGGGHTVTIRDGFNSTDLLVANEGGPVNTPGANLQERGNRVATRVWATGSNILHSELSDAPASAHHTKYTDSEAVAAVNAEATLSVDISGDADTLDGNQPSAFASSGHTHDGRYILEGGDTMSGVLTLHDGSEAASQSWVNNNGGISATNFEIVENSATNSLDFNYTG